MNFAKIIGEMGIVGWAVFGFLFMLSLYSIGVMIDKYRGFHAAMSQSMRYMPELARTLKSGNLQQAIATSKSHEKSHLAKVVSAGVAEFVDTGEDRTPMARVEAAERALDRSTTMTLAELKRGLAGLATIGSIAPFIGLFGTVVGIIHAFQGIAESGSGGIGSVSGGIAEALVATAFGLFVAIPAVMAFNYFTSVLERLQVEMSNTAAELMDYFLKQTEASRVTQ